jgi:peptidyl-prolyl cis-trans isomerase C
MTAPILCVFTCLGVAWAQAPMAQPPAPLPTDIPGDAVVAVFTDGTKLTMDDYMALSKVLPPPYNQMAQQNREMFLKQYAMMLNGTHLAEKEKLEQQSPYKETIEFNRMYILFQAWMSNAINSVPVSSEDIAKFYDEHKESYKEVHVKAIYIAYSNDAASAMSSSVKRKLTEEEAKTKAEKLLAQARGGADFVKLVKENSDDETSRDKNGDFPVFKPTDTVPDDIRKAVFALKEGDVSDPVRQPNGYYLFLASKIVYTPLEGVRDSIFNTLHQQRGMQMLTKMNNEVKVEFPNPKFLGKTAPPAENPAPAVKKPSDK